MTSLMALNNIKNENHVIIASLKSETMGKLINKISGSRLLISSLPGSASLVMSTGLKSLPGKLDITALRKLVESLGKPHNINKCSLNLACKLDIKRHSPNILY